MEIWDSNIVKANLTKLLKLNYHAANTKNRILSIHSKLTSLDGYKRNTRLRDSPSSPGPPQNSMIEHSFENKEDLLQDLQEAKTKYLGLRCEIEKIINTLEYKLRLKEWELIRDVYKDRLSEVELAKAYGDRWKRKLGRIIEQNLSH